MTAIDAPGRYAWAIDIAMSLNIWFKVSYKPLFRGEVLRLNFSRKNVARVQDVFSKWVSTGFVIVSALINGGNFDTFFLTPMFLKLACTIPTALIQLKINGASPPKMSKDWRLTCSPRTKLTPSSDIWPPRTLYAKPFKVQFITTCHQLRETKC